MIRFPPKKILVPFDFTEVSMAAWRQGKSLARRFGASLEAVYTEDLMPSEQFLNWPLERPMMGPRVRKEILARMHAKLGEGAVIHVTEGDAVVVILRYARTLNPDLIVMGTHARSGFERLRLGSVTEAVTRLSPVPVLTVRKFNDNPIRNILAPVNFESYAHCGLLYAAAAADALKAKLTALHVSESDEFDAQFRLSSLVRTVSPSMPPGVRPAQEVRMGKPIEEILTAARRCDLIVLVAHRKSLLKDLVLGTTVERVLRYSPAPVLSVPSPKVSWERPFRRSASGYSTKV